MDAKLAELQAKQVQCEREWRAEEEARAIRAMVSPYGGMDVIHTDGRPHMNDILEVDTGPHLDPI